MRLTALKYFFLGISFLFLLPTSMYGQISTQRIKGRIIDQETNEPISGVEIELMNYVPLKISSSDEFGEYELRSIPIGTHRLMLIHEHYQTLIVPEVEVVLVQPTILNIKMKKEIFLSSSIKVDNQQNTVKKRKKFTDRTLAINPDVVSSAYIYNNELQLHYSGSREDVLQLVANSPGIRPTASFFNELSIRGNNPIYTGYRIEGIPVDNINHLPYPQSSAGAFSLLNPYMVDKFDVYTGGLSANYGHAAAGIIDAKLKTGNAQRTDFNFHISPFWLEASVETPIQRDKGQSLSFGYRQGALSLFDQMGLGVWLDGKSPLLQDAFFKFHLPRTKAGDFTVFGIWGLAKNTTNSQLWLQNTLLNNLQAITGLRHHIRLSAKVYMNTKLGGTFRKYELQTFASIPSVIHSNFNETKGNAILSSDFEFRIDRENILHIGLEGDYYNLNLFQQEAVGHPSVNFTGHTFYTQAHAYLHSKFKQSLTFNVGLQAQYLHLSGAYGISPRVQMRWEFNNHAIVADAGIQQQQLPWFVYLQQEMRDGNIVQPNRRLEFVRNNQASLSYHFRMAENWLLKATGYFQYWDNLPVAADTAIVFILNNMEAYQMRTKIPALSNNGTGYNAGAELSIEKFFNRNTYASLTGAYLDARYFSANGNAYNSRYNSRYYGVLLFGREVSFGAWGSNSFSVDTRFLYSGGLFYTPIDKVASDAAGREVLDWNNAWTARSPDYWSWDVKLTLKIKKGRTLHSLVLEGLNLLNIRSAQAYIFDPTNNDVNLMGNMGRTILLSYRFNLALVKKNNGY